MSDGKVIVTLSVQDAEALRAWQRSKKGIGEMEQELQKAKKAVKAVADENQKLSKAQADGFQQLSAMGREAFQKQSTWSRGLAAIDKQRQAEASAALQALKGQSLAAWGAMGAQIAAAQEKTAAVTRETQTLSKAQADGFARLSAMGAKAFAAQSSWSKGLATMDKQRVAAAIAASKTLRGRMRAVYTGASAALKEFSGDSAEANDTLAGYAKSRLAEWASYATAVGLAVKAVRELIAANKEVRGEEADVTFNLDTEFRRLQVQGQFTEPEAAGVREQVFGIAERQAAKTETVAGVAKQLISSGFDRDLVLRGGAAEELIKGMQASAMSSGETANPAQFTESITQFLSAQAGKEEGEKLTPQEQSKVLSFENLSQAVRQTQGLFLRHNMQFADLTYLARAAPILSKAGLGMTDQLAAFTRLRDVLNPEQAGTGLRNVVSRMQTAGASDMKTGALAEIGLTPQDIDLVGESFDEALARIRDALANVSKEKQAIFLKHVFEEEGAEAASVLIAQVPTLAQYRREARDTGAFDQAHATATQGFAAARQREEVQKQRQRFGGEGADDVLLAEAIEREYSAQGHEVIGKVKRKEFEAARAVGISQAKALSALDFDGDVLTKIERRAADAKRARADFTPVDENLQPILPKQAKRAAPAEEGGFDDSPEARRQRAQKFAQRAGQNAAAAAAKDQEKLDKKLAAEVKAELARQSRAETAKKRLEAQAAAAGRAAQKEQDQAAAGQRQIEEIRRDMRTAQSLRAGGQTRVASPWGAGKKRKAGGRGKSSATQLREQERLHKLEVRLEEAERQRAEHEAKANELMAKQNELLAKIAANTAGNNSPRGAPQKPPPTIGRN